jgi:hypothetical protein
MYRCRHVYREHRSYGIFVGGSGVWAICIPQCCSRVSGVLLDRCCHLTAPSLPPSWRDHVCLAYMCAPNFPSYSPACLHVHVCMCMSACACLHVHVCLRRRLGSTDSHLCIVCCVLWGMCIHKYTLPVCQQRGLGFFTV